MRGLHVFLLFRLLGRLVAVSALSSACAPVAHLELAKARAGNAAPLLVTIVVDQLAAWVAAERWPQLPRDGGFARLLREGTYFEDMRYAHAVTDTAPGHAALYTANVPRGNGIFANEIIPPGGGAPRSILEDAHTHLVGVDGAPTDRAGSSLSRLRGETLADAFVAQVPGALVFSLSLKDRGALFAAGRRPTAALWLDTSLGSFVTSTAFPPPPRWAAPIGDVEALGRVAAAGWTLSADERAFVSEHAPTPDDQAGEGDVAGLGVTFPHPVTSAKALRATPLADHVLLALAREAVRAAVSAHRPALVAVSLSANDYVSHVFGPHSWEAWDELLRLDRELADFLIFLDGAVGTDGYAVMLTADHGSSALPELAASARDPWCSNVATVKRWELPCGVPRRRLEQADLVAALEGAFAKTFGDTFGTGRWIDGIADPLVFFSARGRALPVTARTRAVRVARDALAPFGVADAIDVHAAWAPCSASGSSPAELVCRSLSEDEPADLYLLVRPGVSFNAGLTPGHGANHGSPSLYDRSVPLVILAPGRIPAGQVHAEPVPFTKFARGAALLLGVAPPAEWLPD